MKPETPVRLAIFGGKGGGCHAAQTALNSDRSGGPCRFAGYLNDRLPPGSPLVGGKVLCSFDRGRDLDSDLMFLAPLHKVGFMQQNCARLIKLGVPTSRWTTLIDPRADVADNAEIGLGTYLVPFASMAVDSIVGSHCALRHGSRIGNDVTVGDFVFVGSNAILCSGSVIESGRPYCARSHGRQRRQGRAFCCGRSRLRGHQGCSGLRGGGRKPGQAASGNRANRGPGLVFPTIARGERLLLVSRVG